MRTPMKTLLLASVLAAPALPLAAQNVALVIGNSDYRNASDLTSREHDRLVSAYEAAGFEVTEGEDLNRTALFTLLGGFLEEVEGAERIVIHLNGHTVTTETETWFLPTDANGDSVVRIGLTAPTLDLFLSMVDEASDVGVLFVGTDGERGFEGAGYEVGVGRIYAPRDTLVMTGPVAALSSIVRNRALEPGTGLRALANDLPDGLIRYGFAPRDAVLVDERVEPEPAPLPQVEPAVPQVSPAEQRERDLNLTRDQRRTIQANLTALGYNTRGVDGIFGAGSRGAITAWQQAQSFTATGFLSQGQIDLLAVQADNRRAAEAAEQARAQAEREREDRAFWQATGASGDARGLRRYLENYPDGVFAEQAREQLEALDRTDREARQQEVARAWQQAQDANTVAAYQAFIDSYPQSEFVGTARARIAQIEEASQPVADPLEDARAAEQALGLSSINRALVQIRLQSLGYQVGNISGSFDEITRAGIAAFQRDYGLDATGYVNQPTVRQLITLAGQ